MQNTYAIWNIFQFSHLELEGENARHSQCCSSIVASIIQSTSIDKECYSTTKFLRTEKRTCLYLWERPVLSGGSTGEGSGQAGWEQEPGYNSSPHLCAQEQNLKADQIQLLETKKEEAEWCWEHAGSLSLDSLQEKVNSGSDPNISTVEPWQVLHTLQSTDPPEFWFSLSRFPPGKSWLRIIRIVQPWRRGT